MPELLEHTTWSLHRPGSKHLTSRSRAVVVVLLTGATNLSPSVLARTSGVNGWRLTQILDRLVELDFVTDDYRLTPAGRDWAWDVLGLQRAEVTDEPSEG